MDNETVNFATNLEELSSNFENLVSTISTFRSQLTILQGQVREIERSSKKYIKQLERELRKRKVKGNRKPSGFARPSKISDKLCSFMNKPKGSELARTEVTQYLIAYIKNNKLQNESNKRLINPDKELKTLLGIKDNDKLDYFNLQSYMNQHFVNISKKNQEK